MESATPEIERLTGAVTPWPDRARALVVEDQDGDPKSKWGLVQGITRHSQTLPYADERTALDRAAGKLMAITF